MNFGDYMVELREAKGWTLEQAARELGISPQRLCDIEKGRRNFVRRPPLKFLRLVAEAYEHPFHHLVSQTEVFYYEKQLFTAFVEDIAPLLERLDRSALANKIEARDYTPELSAGMDKLYEDLQELKATFLAAKQRFGKLPKARPFGNEPTLKRSKEG